MFPGFLNVGSGESRLQSTKKKANIKYFLFLVELIQVHNILFNNISREPETLKSSFSCTTHVQYNIKKREEFLLWSTLPHFYCCCFLVCSYFSEQLQPFYNCERSAVQAKYSLQSVLEMRRRYVSSSSPFSLCILWHLFRQIYCNNL